MDLDRNYINYGIDKGLELYCTNSKNLIDRYLKKFDLIILSHVLEHFLDIDSELEIIYKLLKPTGYLYVEVPGLKSLLIGYDKCDFLHYLQNAHTYSFDLDTLVQIMKWSKFIKGDERIHSLFKKVDYRSNTVVNYYNNIKNYLIDLEKNRNKYKKKYENFVEKKSRDEREKKFKIVKQRINNYEDNTVVLYGIGNHTKILLDYIGYTNKILGLLDKEEEKINKMYYGYEVLNLEKIFHKIKAIVIFSDIYQEIIYDRIKNYKKYGIDIVKIY
ncbi:methyltransferase domain-containing protein [Clostridium tyrobutyricum]|uniref:methyltransferase domain-containing protein n=1 Tax=Clostridium tyrobutyricum TaxID=1519 RepID=UPI001C3907A6|nr:class I SAM-dependent methyltransferase [Clostridium tyrobutyricum]MBV4443303.1 class I SAM-dependent methyltransferase [Clostridium tyrobutyricum]